MTKDDFLAFSDHIKSAKGIIITAHQDPDIDAIGSCLAMHFKLQELGIRHIIWLADNIIEANLFLPDSHIITNTIDSPDMYDTLLVLDCSDLNRVKHINKQNLDLSELTIINIDHHADNTLFGQINVFKTLSSVGEQLFKLFTALEWTISKDMASCLYAAIIFDTGRFLYSNTSADVLDIGAQLVRLGANSYRLSQSLFENKSEKTFKIIQIALDNLKINHDLNYAYTKIPIGFPHQNFKVIDFIRQLGDISIFIVFTEVFNQKIKINLRSKEDFNVMQFSKEFGGGGHEKAAGIFLEGPIDDVANIIITRLEKYLG